MTSFSRSRQASMSQGRAVLEIFEHLPAERLQGIGMALLHLVREYLAGEKQKELTLGILRRYLDLPSLPEELWASVVWEEIQPEERSGSAVIRKPGIERQSSLVRLRPTHLGLSNDDHPQDVIDLAQAWGYKPVPCAALDVLLNSPTFHFGFSGTAMVPLGDGGQYAYLRIDKTGLIREVEQMDVTAPNFATTWSVIMAC